jgi:hypothetical protein
METHEWTKLRLEKRNARERNRVRQVNKEFEQLRQVLVKSHFLNQIEECQSENSKTSSDSSSLFTDFLMEKENYEDLHEHKGKCKKLSKLRILKLAIDYIEHLSGLLQQSVNLEEESVGYYSNTATSCNLEDFSFSIKSEENYYYLPCEEQQMNELQRFDLTMRQIKAKMMSNESCDLNQADISHFEAADLYHF